MFASLLVGVALVAIAAGILLVRRERRATATLVFVLALGLSVPGAVLGSAAPASATTCEDPGVGTTPPQTPEPTPTPTPTATPVVCPESDKSPVLDADGDTITDACDLDSDNDGILDAEEDADLNGKFNDDDAEGNFLVVPQLGDGIPSYLDLDSDNDGVMDLMEGRVLTRAQIDVYDADHNGIFDLGQSFGSNGLLDDLETAPDSGVFVIVPDTLRNNDGDDKPNYLDVTSDGVEFDLYAIGRSDLDEFGAGFITLTNDADRDGIMDTNPNLTSPGVDTDPAERGAPGSPYSHTSS